MSTISFARGIPGPDLLPVDDFGEAARAAAARDGSIALNYGPPGGYPPLREWIAQRHGVDPGRVVITNGSLQGFNFLARHAAASDLKIFVEAPCYDRTLSIIRRVGAEAEAIPLREDGLDVEALADALERSPGPSIVYTIPTFQNPSGRTLSLENRHRLIELARERGATILEDDPYGLLRFEGDDLPTLFDLSGGDGCLFLTSFSKTVAPGIRVGYLILSEELVSAVEGYVLENYVSPSIFVEAALFEFVSAGRFEPNLERVRGELRIRRDAMLGALERDFPAGTGWSEPEGGYFLWLDFPPGVDAGGLLGRAADEGVTFIKGSDFYLSGGGEGSARLAFSYATADEIDEGIRRLGGLVRDAAAVTA